MNREERQFVW